MSFSWKSARDKMRADSNVATEYQRLEQFVALVFLRIYNALEEEWEDEADSEERDFRSALKPEYKWTAWAIPGPDGKSMTGDTLVQHLNNIYKHCAQMDVTGLEPRQKIVRKVFEGLTQHMRNGQQLRELIDIVNELNYHDAKQRNLFGQMYEEMLRIMQSSKETGEYYTPRAVTQFIVERLNPELGQRFGDFACGTGGFLTAAIDHLNKQGIKSGKQVEQLQNAIVGCELKAIPYLLCATNMLVHGIDNPDLTSGTAFTKNINDFEEYEKVDVVGMNPPYGGMTTAAELNNFPENVRTKETAVLFIAYIAKRLKENGRAGVIIPDGFLFATDGASVEVKKILVQNFNLHTIIRLPQSIFAPYTSIATNILFFDNKKADGAPKGFATKETWVYRIDMPDGVKHFSKTKPVRSDLFNDANLWWDSRREIIIEPGKDEKSRCYPVEQLRSLNYNLDLCKYPKQEEVIIPLNEFKQHFDQNVMQQLQTINQDLDEIFKVINE